MMTFLEFLEQKNNRILTEAFKTSDLKHAVSTICELLRKHTNGAIQGDMGAYPSTRGGKDFISFLIPVWNGGKISNVLSLDFLKSEDSNHPYSFAFYDAEAATKILWGKDEDIQVKSICSVYTLGSSIVFFIPIIERMINDGTFKITKAEAERAAKTVYKESFDNSQIKKRAIIFEGNLKYNVYSTIYNTNKVNNIIEESFKLNSKMIREKSELEDRRTQAGRNYRTAKDNGDAQAAKQFLSEYNYLRKAIDRGLTTNEEFDMMMKNGETTRFSNPLNDIQGSEEGVTKLKKLEREHKDPKTAFKEMETYLAMVVKGIQPGLVVCGGPGTGKTYRIQRFLKMHGYEDGDNMHIIKGKCTTRNLYLDLYKYQDKGQIILIDDADSLIGPKAAEDTINILKGALDSTGGDEGRKIAYRVSADIKDDDGEIVPKEFNYNGSVIVITNYNIGQIDTAIRTRVFTQNLDFNTEDMLNLIKEIMPGIMPDLLSSKAKMKAYDYLSDIAEEGIDMEISVRSFTTCAKLFEMAYDSDYDTTEEQAMSMIKEQVLNQALRGGKHF